MPVTARVKFIASASTVIILLAALIVGLTVGLRTPAPPNGGSPPDVTTTPPPDVTTTTPPKKDAPPSEVGSFRFAAVSSDATKCAQIATDIMGRKGGTAVDAAIAGMLCVGVVNRHSSGLGGGHFMTVYHTPRDGGDKEVKAIMARETAPGASHEEMYINTTASPVLGGTAVAVPGEVMGFYTAWQRYGRVEWEDLFYPTIRLLTEGYTVERSLAGAIDQYADLIKSTPNLREIFVMENGEVAKEGDIIKDVKLAQTMQRIALDPHTFYNGSLARDIVQDLNEADFSQGLVTEEDLANYTAKLKEALQVNVNNGNFVLYGPPPPSSGVVLQYIMKILDGFNFKPSDLDTTDSKVLAYHRIVEAFKFAYAKRSALGDEDFWDVSEIVKNMTSDDYIMYIRSRIDDSRTHNVSYYEPEFETEADDGTVHLGVLDQYGNAVSMTSTINLFFGSKVRGTRTGIMFNNCMDDFSTPGTSNWFGVPASPSNYIAPGKMSMSSMSPMIFMTSSGTPEFISGASGGTRITTQTAGVVINALWFGQDIKTATDMPRFHHQLMPNVVDYEAALDPEVVTGLAGKGHQMAVYGDYMAVVGSIHNRCEECLPDCLNVYCISAVADGRKGGVPDGL